LDGTLLPQPLQMNKMMMPRTSTRVIGKEMGILKEFGLVMMVLP